MKICVLNPTFLLTDPKKNFNGYNFYFLKKYVKYIFITDYSKLFHYYFICKKYKLDIKFIFSVKNLNKNCKVLISFNGHPYKRFHIIPSNFYGLKLVHIMDFNFSPSLSNSALKKSGVHYLFTYNDHSLYSDFFKMYYPDYLDKIITVPFGFSDRFSCLNKPNSRKKKAIALGSVNPIDDPYAQVGSLTEYVSYYSDYEFTHSLRRFIVENRTSLQDFVDDYLPTFPETKNANYDPVSLLNKYLYFINDEGILNFPPARTFEGIACGSIMIARKNKIYNDLGFIDGYNCIMLDNLSVDSISTAIDKYNKCPNKVAFIQKNSLELSNVFSHEKISDNIYEDIINLC